MIFILSLAINIHKLINPWSENMILKKDIKTYNSRRQINIKKNELLNEDIAFVYTSEEHTKVQDTIKSLNNEVE